ncbi:hypothetical protein Ssi03_26050 [Sphaerisporangium siamense]|uniref:Uncharacterized protein n=1 Tax=Sphaerisporangium siamense TaxID=795645 RepID=A0A7W7D4B8_9ACTN|nr:hypothetical protein [Sphaerisporangium siamense]MBB4700067.1 hypothetical protein [Sphaerisporangium siamense]GII84615.1 hypothetical protein Ssi03_26050 [Sphaerisporangium siamense]
MSQRTTCPPWCNTAHSSVDVEHESIQHVLETPRGDVALQLLQQPGAPVRMLAATLRPGTSEHGDADLALDDAEALARAILAQVAAARA